MAVRLVLPIGGHWPSRTVCCASTRKADASSSIQQRAEAAQHSIRLSAVRLSVWDIPTAQTLTKPIGNPRAPPPTERKDAARKRRGGDKAERTVGHSMQPPARGTSIRLLNQDGLLGVRRSVCAVRQPAAVALDGTIAAKPAFRAFPALCGSPAAELCGQQS